MEQITSVPLATCFYNEDILFIRLVETQNLASPLGIAKMLPLRRKILRLYKGFIRSLLARV